MGIEQASPGASADRLVAELIDALAVIARGRAATDALEASLLAGLVDESGALGSAPDSGMVLRSVAAELGAALRTSDRTMQRRLSDAYTLVHTFPAVLEAMSRGEISRSHAGVIVDAGTPLSPEAREEFVPRALELARAESPNRLRSMLAVVAEHVQERGITERHRGARQARSIWVTDEPDGMSILHALLPSVLAHGAMDRVSQIARGIRGARSTGGSGAPAKDRDEFALAGGGGCAERPIASAEDLASACEDAPCSASPMLPGFERGEEAAAGGAVVSPHGAENVDVRTLDQTRADVLADLLLAATANELPTGLGAVHATVSVIVPAATLTENAESGAILAGVGPIDTDSASQLAQAAPGWDRIAVDPEGTVLSTDRYRPTAAIRRLLRALDIHCRFPGCRQPTIRCDADHSTDWAYGGTTDTDNLAHLCKRHHTLKHAKKWTVTNLGAGLLEWTSPLGYTYTDSPPSKVLFQAALAVPEVDGAFGERVDTRESIPRGRNLGVAPPPQDEIAPF